MERNTVLHSLSGDTLSDLNNAQISEAKILSGFALSRQPSDIL